ncbi:antitoxin FitA [Methylomarinovum tepidoasis]|uniref:Antitoxin FitA n=1 Tax=Methylomarinovum tepidoasis TaxID=2840183 RepID=A0AAU9D3Q1_9GAMM|nr:hypothetical protein [Methylomarinovum sp. IN45]BCX89604.1 antitoxin FitA [Methylomarinovum sp. IN45]
MQIEIPKEMYEILKFLAKRHHRDLEQETLRLLEKGVLSCEGLDVLTQAQAWRRRLQGRELGDSIREIREDRDR